MTFTAQYHGACANCGSDVKDTEVAYGTDDQLEHVECPDPMAPTGKGVCSRCFTELPLTGVCGVCEL